MDGRRTAMLLGAYEADAAGALDAKDAKLQEQLADMRADVFRAMGELGFNLTILPKGQEITDWYAQDESAPTMPEAAVRELREAGLPLVRNSVGQLRRRITWPEQKWPIVVAGRGAPERTATPARPTDGKPSSNPAELERTEAVGPEVKVAGNFFIDVVPHAHRVDGA